MGIAVEMSGDEAKLWRSYQRIIEQQKKLDGAMEKGAKVAKTTAAANEKMFSPEVLAQMEKHSQGFDDVGNAARMSAIKAKTSATVYKESYGSKALGQIKDYAGGFTGIGTAAATASAVALLALREINAEIETQIKLQKEAAAAQVTLASAHQDLRRNMTGKSDTEITDAFKATEAISKETGVDEKYIAQAYAQGVSASGGDMEATKSAVSISAKQLSDQPENIARFAGSLLDVASVTGTKDAEVNMGLLQKTGGMSRVVDPAMIAQNVAPALVGMKEFGATMQESAALFSALTVSGKDTQGATSGTAGIQLAKQLDEFAKAKGFDGTMGQEIAALQANPKMAEEFLKGTSDKDKEKLKGKREGEIWGGASFDVKALGPIMSLLQDSQSEGATAYQANLGGLGSEGDLRTAAQKSIEQRGLAPTEGVATMDRLGANAINQMEVGNIEAGALGKLEEHYNPLIEKSGASWTERFVGNQEIRAATYNPLAGDDRATAQVKNLDMRADILEKGGKNEEASAIREFLQSLNETLQQANSTNKELLDALKDGSKSRKTRSAAG